MRFLSVAHTDIGTTKKINQDAFCLKIAKTPKHNIAFAVLCDGMGGLNSGELASAFVVNAFSNWFENEFPVIIENGFDYQKITARWNEIVLDQGRKIMNYGQVRGISLGTTLTTVLIVDNEYVTIHVGDSRLYKISDTVQQLTKDQTLVALEVEQKKITPEQARVDSRKNVLLQCIGASKVIVPEIQRGIANEGDVFLICSDGFRHEVSEEEMFGVMAPQLLNSEKIMKTSLMDLIDLNKARGEKDNISAVLIKAIR